MIEAKGVPGRSKRLPRAGRCRRRRLNPANPPKDSHATPAPMPAPETLVDSVSLMPVDPNAGTGDMAKIRRRSSIPPASPQSPETHKAELNLETLGAFERQRLTPSSASTSS